MTKKIPTTLGILIILLVAGVAGASVLFFSQGVEEKTDTENHLTAEENEITEIIKEDVSGTNDFEGWRTYENDEYGFEIKYPSNWPRGEDRETLMSSLGHLFSFSAKQMTKNEYNQLSISVWDNSTYSYNQLKQPPPGGIYHDTVKREDTIINGHPAVKFSYTSASDVYETIPAQRVSILRNKLVYVIECYGDKCDQALSSFKFY